MQSVNATKSSIRGAEVGANLDISERLTANAILNYTWGRETLDTGVVQPADRIPPLSGKLALQFTASDAWLLDAWLRMADAQDRLSDRDIRDVRIDPQGTPGWLIAGARASWFPDESWSVELLADNLLDKRYRVHGSGIDAPGRNFAVTVRATW